MKLKTIILFLIMSLTCNLKAQSEYYTDIDSNTVCHISILENNYLIQLYTSVDYDIDYEYDYSFGTIQRAIVFACSKVVYFVFSSSHPFSPMLES